MKNTTNLQIKIKRFLRKLKIPEFLHHFGPKKYKLENHVCGLLMMQICNASFRRVVKIANLFGQKCPTYSALCKRRKNISAELWQKLLRITAGLSSGKLAIDGTGFSKTNPSFHYLKRIDGNNPKNYAKLSALMDLKSKKFLVMRIRTTPRHDMQDVKYLLGRVRDVKVLCGDSGYDAEWLHELCYWRGIQTYIPPRQNVRLRRFRKKQLENWNKEEYNKRSNVESGFSAIKGKYCGAIRAKKIWGIRAEILSKGVVHNLGLCD